MATTAPRRTPLVIVLGTTGVGKSDSAVQLAAAVGGEVVNGDSLQVYKGVDVITNKLPVQERMGVKHHLLDIRDATDVYSVTEFQTDAALAIDEITARRKVPIVVGGTHYYLQYLLWGNDFNVDGEDGQLLQASADVRRTEEYQRYTTASTAREFWDILRVVDPVMADRWHPNDDRKVKRSLEARSVALCDVMSERAAASSGASHLAAQYNVLIFWLHAEWAQLDARLDKRVDAMLERGLLDEVRWLRQNVALAAGPQRLAERNGLLQAIGYAELLPLVELLDRRDAVAAIDDDKLERARRQAIEAMKTATRRYARKQVSWIRNKLLRRLRQDGLQHQMFVLDASDLGNWESNVCGKMVSVTKALLAGDALPSPQEVCPHADNLLASSQPEAALSTWKKYKCDVCDKTVNGLHEWNVHLTSKHHRRLCSKRKKQLGDEHAPQKRPAGAGVE
ncbi:tRNA dimethylallyltransferase, mitochondrial [Sorochytrium milnesiophthora]